MNLFSLFDGFISCWLTHFIYKTGIFSRMEHIFIFFVYHTLFWSPTRTIIEWFLAEQRAYGMFLGIFNWHESMEGEESVKDDQTDKRFVHLWFICPIRQICSNCLVLHFTRKSFAVSFEYVKYFICTQTIINRLILKWSKSDRLHCF